MDYIIIGHNLIFDCKSPPTLGLAKLNRDHFCIHHVYALYSRPSAEVD